VSSNLQLCFVFQHAGFEGQELHAVRQWSKVKNEGAATHLFGADDTTEEEEKEEGAREPEVGLQIPTEVLHAGNCLVVDIAQVRALGVIDDGNSKPAPENKPIPQENNNNAATNGRAWGWAGIDN
jgi:hypothetical protein